MGVCHKQLDQQPNRVKDQGVVYVLLLPIHRAMQLKPTTEKVPDIGLHTFTQPNKTIAQMQVQSTKTWRAFSSAYKLQ